MHENTASRTSFLRQILFESASPKSRKLIAGHFTTIIIASYLLTALITFYASSMFGVGQISQAFVLLAIAVDGVYVLIHLPRKRVKHQELSFDPKKLTVLIACYNGEEILPETIRQAMVHVPAEQIVVISDASTDKTAEVARSFGVQVVINKRNVNKAFSVSNASKHIATPYTLVLDDDTLIGKTLIPTNLMDNGYSAVAFNVLPVYTGKLVNKFQMFEYRKSMVMGKSLRGNVGAIGNVSGAIGLFRTKDLQHQATRHSGQFGGEDQQRTSFVHLLSTGRGVTYTESAVYTQVPDTWRSLIRQRSFRWNLSLPELFVTYSRIVISPRHHYLLKAEKLYQMYLYLTDPVRMLFFWVLFLNPLRLVQLVWFYALLNVATWFKIGRKDPLWVALAYPVYSLLENICRYVAHFYWFKIKYEYVFKHKFHRLVPDRRLRLEYAVIVALILPVWFFTSTQAYEAASHVTTQDLMNWGVLDEQGEPVEQP
jgi:cellulose synthase/poly-beta-1,6-N-acetylglucosamine synthase-like glycosyltransferase